jgi:DNA-binding transcriptional LysR family regulator
MDSNRLRYFAIVNETGSIRRAAELLRLSPAALSKAMKLLEDEVGFALLVPSGRGILVTDEGKELAKRAAPILDGLASLAQDVRLRYEDASHSAAPLRIGSFEVFTTHCIGQLLPAMSYEADVLLREVIPGEMERALLNREVDYGITYLPIATSGVEHLRVASIEMGIFGSTEFEKKFKDKPFDEMPFVVPIEPISGSPNKVQGLDGWPDDRIYRLIRHRVTLLESALEICRKGLAAAYLPSFVVALHNETVKPKHQLQIFPHPPKLGLQKQAVYIAKRKSDLEGEIFKKLARAVRLVCKN